MRGQKGVHVKVRVGALLALCVDEVLLVIDGGRCLLVLGFSLL